MSNFKAYKMQESSSTSPTEIIKEKIFHLKNRGGILVGKDLAETLALKEKAPVIIAGLERSVSEYAEDFDGEPVMNKLLYTVFVGISLSKPDNFEDNVNAVRMMLDARLPPMLVEAVGASVVSRMSDGIVNIKDLTVHHRYFIYMWTEAVKDMRSQLDSEELDHLPSEMILNFAAPYVLKQFDSIMEKERIRKAAQ